MKKVYNINIIGFNIWHLQTVFAVTLKDALKKTYKNNTELNAERENIKVSEQEDINISKSDYYLQLTLQWI